MQLNDAQPAAASLAELKQIQGLFEKLSPLEINAKSKPETHRQRRRVSPRRHVRPQAPQPHRRAQLLRRGKEISATMRPAQYAERMREREVERDDYAKNRTRRGFN